MNYPIGFLTDEELFTVVKNSDYSKFLEPIRQNSKRYEQYNALLGTKTKKSILVQKNLPGIVISLFRNKDNAIVKAMEECAQNIANELLEYVSQSLEREISAKDIKSFSNEEIADIIKRHLEDKSHAFDRDLFLVQMKLNECTDMDKRIDEIISLCGLEKDEIEDDKEIVTEEESDDEQITSLSNDDYAQTKPKTKHKKLTAQEKAAKTKAALEAKEKAKQKEIAEQEDEHQLDDDSTENVTEEVVENYEKIIPKYIKSTEDDEVSKYIGIISIISNYYNFMPIGTYADGKYNSLSEAEIDSIIPQSQKHNINFFYNVWDSNVVDFMRTHFLDGQPVLLSCDLDELEENRTADGTLNPTGYKYPAIDGYNNGKISLLSNAGLYKLINKDDLLDDIELKKVVRINQDNLVDGEKILVNLKKGFYAGPYTVKYSPTTYTYHFMVQPDDKKRFLVGYNSSDCSRVVIEPSIDVEEWIGGYDKWTCFFINRDAKEEYKDLITDKELLESLKNAIEKTQELDYSNLDINGIVDRLGSSQIVGESLPEEIKQQRIERIKMIMSDEEKLKQLYTDASDLIYDLLLNNKDSMQTEQLISSIIENRPDLLDKMQGVRAVQIKVENARAELESLKAQKEETAEEMKNMRTESALNSYDEVVSKKITAEIAAKNEELDIISERLNIAKEALGMQEKLDRLKEDTRYYESHKTHLQNDAKNLESNFVELVNGYSEKMADITFDGFMSSKMLQAAATWEANNDKIKLDLIVDSFNSIKSEVEPGDSLVDYIIDRVKTVRPGYNRNDIINIMICSVQGFLTVFSGAPGCGKTSICNILSDVLGLNDYDKASEELDDIRRFIPVSVERGWTSKRDLVGYYNPLTKAFEESNREVYDGLRLLDAEAHNKYAKWPFYILLDEANLSPMEYYWADFMNVCDDTKSSSTINLGNNNVFRIPETLHFWATINNDHTTETLSPRLIDRAWVITLPRVPILIREGGSKIDGSTIKNVSWDDLKTTFTANSSNKNSFDRDTQAIYDGLKEKLKEQGIYISPRVDIAILRYWLAAISIMEEDDYGNSPELIALDYAISQKILPKFSGAGEEYEVWLESIKTYCDSKNLNHTVNLVSEMLDRGNRRMKYYQFFS